MFQLVRRSDTMPIKPCDFNRDLRQVLIELINEKYANQVIADVGLVISLYDIDIIGDGHLVPDNGCAYTEVTFRLIVFRPFTGETLYGSLLRQTPESIQISLGFLQEKIFLKLVKELDIKGNYNLKSGESSEEVSNLVTDLLNVTSALQFVHSTHLIENPIFWYTCGSVTHCQIKNQPPPLLHFQGFLFCNRGVFDF